MALSEASTGNVATTAIHSGRVFAETGVRQGNPRLWNREQQHDEQCGGERWRHVGRPQEVATDGTGGDASKPERSAEEAGTRFTPLGTGVYPNPAQHDGDDEQHGREGDDSDSYRYELDRR